jgi:hypothetical protein
LSLLAVLSIAADEMVAEESISANNYYLRLSNVLARSGGTAPDPKALGKLYAKPASIDLWRSLTTWLEAWQGDRGKPTVPLPVDAAEIVARKYIRMPISQALLRESDRSNLYKMFSANNLDPAMSVSEQLMFALLEQWTMSPYTTSQLKKIWKVEEYRESLVLLVISALDTWPGAELETNGETTTSSKVGLTLVLDKWMNRAEFGIEIRYAGPKSPNEIEIRTADESFTRSMVVPAGPKSVRIADLSAEAMRPGENLVYHVTGRADAATIRALNAGPAHYERLIEANLVRAQAAKCEELVRERAALAASRDSAAAVARAGARRSRKPAAVPSVGTLMKLTESKAPGKVRRETLDAMAAASNASGRASCRADTPSRRAAEAIAAPRSRRTSSASPPDRRSSVMGANSRIAASCSSPPADDKRGVSRAPHD